MEAGLIIALVIGAILITFVAKGLVIVQQSEAMVIERLGSFHRILGPGINWVIPFVDLPRSLKVKRIQVINGQNVAVATVEKRIDRRETVLDFPPQPVITTDNVGVHVNGALYFQIIDPERAVYEVENLIQAIEVLAKTSLRSEIGKMELDQLFESREEINAKLQIVMDEAGDKWGVKVNRVEIQDISIPTEVEEAMRKQMVAERERRATIRTAEGQKQADITTAEGARQAAILRAEGDKEAAILRAEGERKAIEQLLSAGDNNLRPDQVLAYLLGLEYLKTLPHIAQEGDRILLPYEASSFLGALGAIQEVSKLGSLIQPGKSA